MSKLAALVLVVLVVACGEPDSVEQQLRVAASDGGAQVEADAGGALAPDAGSQLVGEADAATAHGESDAATADAGQAQVTPDAAVQPRHVSTGAVQSLFQVTCETCHSVYASTKNYVGPDLLHGFTLMLDAVSNCNGMPYVTPGSLENSYIYAALQLGAPCGQHTPVDGLSADEMALIRDWILSGATEEDER